MAGVNVQKLHDTTDHWGWVGGLFLGSNDDGVALRLLAGEGYEPESRKLWMQLCEGAELVIDVGAHTGIYSLDAWKAGAKGVMSIEPYHLNYGRLVMNLRGGGFGTEGTIFCAASDVNETVSFTVTTPNDYCSAGGRIGKALNAIHYPVYARRLDDLLKAEFHDKVRVVKIDTEKHGVRVLRGMTKILEHKPDLILECIEPGLGEILKPLGYKFFVIDEETGLEPCDDLIPDDPFTFRRPNRYATCR